MAKGSGGGGRGGGGGGKRAGGGLPAETRAEIDSMDAVQMLATLERVKGAAPDSPIGKIAAPVEAYIRQKLAPVAAEAATVRDIRRRLRDVYPKGKLSAEQKARAGKEYGRLKRAESQAIDRLRKAIGPVRSSLYPGAMALTVAADAAIRLL